jgi:hypothetical protein
VLPWLDARKERPLNLFALYRIFVFGFARARAIMLSRHPGKLNVAPAAISFAWNKGWATKRLVRYNTSDGSH